MRENAYQQGEVKFAFFDLDETLHDKRASLTKASRHIYDMFDLTNYCSYQAFECLFVTENEIIQPKIQVFSNIVSQLRLPKKPDTLLEEFDKSFHQFCQIFPGVNECLESLVARGIRIGCITNGRDFFQRNKIKGLGIERYFSLIVTSGELNIKKPDHRIFFHALDALGAKSNESFYCGDSIESDMVPAKAIGFTTILKTSTESACSVADFTFQHYADFPMPSTALSGT